MKKRHVFSFVIFALLSCRTDSITFGEVQSMKRELDKGKKRSFSVSLLIVFLRIMIFNPLSPISTNIFLSAFGKSILSRLLVSCPVVAFSLAESDLLKKSADYKFDRSSNERPPCN